MIAASQLERTQGETALAEKMALCQSQIYWLALLLTGDEDASSALTQGSATELLTGNRVFDRWRVNWVHRAIVRACIALKQPELEADEHNSSWWNAAADELDILHMVRATTPESIDGKIRALPILPRFMLVMHLVKKYSLEEAAELLRIPKETCEAALGYALAALLHPIQSSELGCWVKNHRWA